MRLRQVLDNLIGNALAHGASRGPVVVRTSRTGEHGAAIAVADTGPGIPRDEVDRIFDLGVRLDADAMGSGLGLALSRAIVDAHGGALEVESKPGEGSTFTIVLPARSPQPAT